VNGKTSPGYLSASLSLIVMLLSLLLKEVPKKRKAVPVSDASGTYGSDFCSGQGSSEARFRYLLFDSLFIFVFLLSIFSLIDLLRFSSSPSPS